jgi:hypothetical protein
MMKKQSRVLVSLSVLLAVFAVGCVQPALYAQDTTLAQRLEQYKKDRNINTKQETQSIKLRCSVAQAALKNLLVRINTAQSSRQTAYKNISDILANLQKSLNEQAFEISTLKSVTDTYNAKVTVYTGDITVYKQAVEDAIAVNCVEDPHGFRGALETARLYHDKLVPDITDIRSYTTNTVKTSLTQIKVQLSSGHTTGGQQ